MNNNTSKGKSIRTTEEKKMKCHGMEAKGRSTANPLREEK
jgi:hypothetical protein